MIWINLPSQFETIISNDQSSINYPFFNDFKSFLIITILYARFHYKCALIY